MSWLKDAFDSIVDPIKRAGQSTIDIVRGEANSDDWKRLGAQLCLALY